MQAVHHDLRYALRLLLRSPGFTGVAVLTLALGIAATTTVYTWIDGMLVHPLPGVVDDGRLAILENVVPDGKTQDPNISFADFRDFRDRLTLLDGLCLRESAPATIGEGENSQRAWGELVSGNYFGVLGVKPMLGRVFAPDEYSDKPAEFAAVISYRLWRNMFGSDRGVIGRIIRANRQQVTIVGVAPPNFHGVTPGLAFDIWVPLILRTAADRERRQYGAVGRLKPGVTVSEAHAQTVAVWRQITSLRGITDGSRSARLVPIWKAENWGASAYLLGPLQILAAACALVLLIACANVANLLLGRAAARQKELGIRVMLGVSPGRLVRQLLTESLLLAAFATIASILALLWTANALAYFIPPTSLPVWFELSLNGRVIAFAILTCGVTAMLSGLPPALRSLRANLNEQLRAGGRSDSVGAESYRTGNVLVVAEVTLALVALVGAGLFLRSFQALRSIQPGFDPNHVLVSQLYLATSNYTPSQEKQFCLRLRNHLAAAPGVEAVSYSDSVPLGFGLMGWDRIEVDGYSPTPGAQLNVQRSSVAPGYFDLLRIPLLGGRDFNSADGPDAPRVIIVNETFARRFFAGRNPIGGGVRIEKERVKVVGVVKDSKYSRLEETPQPFFYLSYDQSRGGSGGRGIAVYMRTPADPASAAGLLRRAVTAIDATAGDFEWMPLAEQVGAGWFALRLATILVAGLGAISLLLAAVGLYGVIAYWVSRRTQEIGLRMALGAQPRDVLRSVLLRGMALTIAGLGIGLAASLALARLIASMLFGITATDPLTLGSAALFLACVAFAATFLPARRATRVDPMMALRCP